MDCLGDLAGDMAEGDEKGLFHFNAVLVVHGCKRGMARGNEGGAPDGGAQAAAAAFGHAYFARPLAAGANAWIEASKGEQAVDAVGGVSVAGAWNEGVDGADLGHDDCLQDCPDAGNGGQEGVLFWDIFFDLGFIGDDLFFEQIDFLNRHADGHFGGRIRALCRERRTCCGHDLFDAF